MPSGIVIYHRGRFHPMPPIGVTRAPKRYHGFEKESRKICHEEGSLSRDREKRNVNLKTR